MVDGLSAHLVASTSQIDAAIWNRLAAAVDPHGNPFLDHAFFLALEQSGCVSPSTGWTPRHLVLEDGGKTVAILPLFDKTHSQGEYVFDHGWANAYEQAGGRYYPKFQSSLPFTPVTAPKLLAQDDSYRPLLLAAAEASASELGRSSIHATFLPAEEAEWAKDAGWLLRSDTQYHWKNEGFRSFADYLDTMSSRHRKSTRRERRDALDSITVRWLTGSDLTEGVWDAFFEFYQDTGSRKWGRPYLNRLFFSLLSASMSDRILLILAYDRETPIAGSLNLIGRDRLYGRYWGATRSVPFLHFELCYYQAIDYAIAHGLSVVEAGAQGEHKLARGYLPVKMQSAHWIAHAGLRAAVDRFLREERAAVAREQEALETYTPFKKGG